MRLPTADGATRDAEVALCVGSRRYQQYFERTEGEAGVTMQRLPLLWHVAESRWLHVNGVFLEPDNDNWDAHRAIWNANCIFCHNTGVAPGLRDVPELGLRGPEKHFDSHVADLGIACEACHGPGRDHARRNASLVHRYQAQLGRAPAPDIVAPPRLAAAENTALCGQCHSQRLPDPLEKIWTFLDTGPTFRPGDLLAGHVTPLTRDTPVPDPRSPATTFRDRFWSDGTARLTAYEFLGVQQSPCARGGKYSCSSCHVMHGGDVAGQIEPGLRGDAACTQCHDRIAADISAHTHHAAASSGSRCLDCHMPRMVYGVLEIHRSHRVESPDVRRDVEGGRPNACTGCHADRDALWAADRMRDFWGPRYQRPTARPDGAPLDIPEALASLHAGDPVQRAVTLSALGRPGLALAPRDRGFVLANVLVGLGDGYGAVRLLARRAALELDGALGLGMHQPLAAFDVQAPRTERDHELASLLARFEATAPGRLAPAPTGRLIGRDFRLDHAALRALLGRQQASAISIGE